MNVIWIIPAVLSFIGGQVYLFRCLKRLDQVLENRPGNEPAAPCDNRCRYPEEDVVE